MVFRYKTYSSAPLAYTKENVNNTLKQIEYLKGDMGGTQLFEPLEYVYNSKNNENLHLPQHIFILTDGYTENKEKALDIIEKNKSKYQIYAFGIGNDFDEDFIRTAGEVGFGSYKFINNIDNLSVMINEQLKKCMRQYYDKVKFNVEKINNNINNNELIYDFYRNEFILENQLVNYSFIMKGKINGNIEIKNSYNQGEKQFIENFKFNEDQIYTLKDGDILSKITIYSLIRRGEGEDFSQEEKTKKIAKKYQVLCEYTSLFAEVENAHKNKEGNLEIVNNLNNQNNQNIFNNSNNTGFLFSNNPNPNIGLFGNNNMNNMGGGLFGNSNYNNNNANVGIFGNNNKNNMGGGLFGNANYNNNNENLGLFGKSNNMANNKNALNFQNNNLFNYNNNYNHNTSNNNNIFGNNDTGNNNSLFGNNNNQSLFSNYDTCQNLFVSNNKPSLFVDSYNNNDLKNNDNIFENNKYEENKNIFDLNENEKKNNNITDENKILENIIMSLDIIDGYWEENEYTKYIIDMKLYIYNKVKSLVNNNRIAVTFIVLHYILNDRKDKIDEYSNIINKAKNYLINCGCSYENIVSRI